MNYVDRIPNKQLVKNNRAKSTAWLTYDHQWEGLEKMVQSLDSCRNFYKVESHEILTETLFLFYTFGIIVSFEKSNQNICFKNIDGEFIVEWERLNDLRFNLYKLRSMTEYSDDVSYSYMDYRQATRDITDHLKEDHNARNTWDKLLKLSKEYFDGKYTWDKIIKSSRRI